MLHKKINTVRTQYEEFEAYYESNKEDLNDTTNAQKDLKFFWRKKQEQLKQKIESMAPALQRAIKNN